MRFALQLIVLTLTFFYCIRAVRLILTLRGKSDRASRGALMLNVATISAGAGLFAYILLTRVNENVGNILTAGFFAVGVAFLLRANHIDPS